MSPGIRGGRGLALVMARIPLLLCPSPATRWMRHCRRVPGKPGRKHGEGDCRATWTGTNLARSGFDAILRTLSRPRPLGGDPGEGSQVRLPTQPQGYDPAPELEREECYGARRERPPWQPHALCGVSLTRAPSR